jgi:hypothetical protein
VRRFQITVADNSISYFDKDERINRIIDSNNPYTHKYETNTSRISMTETISKLSQHYGESLQDLQIFEISLEEVLSVRFSQSSKNSNVSQTLLNSNFSPKEIR